MIARYLASFHVPSPRSYASSGKATTRLRITLVCIQTRFEKKAKTYSLSAVTLILTLA